MNRLIGLFVLLLAFQQIAAQETDSLESIVRHDTTSYLTRKNIRQHLFIRLAYTDIPRSRAIARQGLAESIGERDTAAMAAFANFLGVSFWIDGENSDSVFIWLRRSAGWARCAGDEKRQMLATFALANEFNKRDMPDSALVRFLEVLPYFERRQDDKSTGATLLNIALLYKIRSHDGKALEYLFRARECGERSGNDQLLGHVFKVLADYQSDDPSRALDYAGRAVTHFRRAGNIFEESAALAAVGWLQYTLAHNARKGIEQLEKARILSEKHNFRTLIADQNGQLAELYLVTGNYFRAGKCLDTALEAADTTNVILCRRLEERQLSYYIHTGRAEKALALHNRRLERQIHDSRKELLTALSDAEIRYETDKKEARIEMLSRTRSIYMVLLFACCLVVVLLVSVLILRGRYQRQKRLRMEEHLRQMEREQKLQSARALLRGEMKERSRLSRELHDGLGGLLTMVKLALEKLHELPEIPPPKMGRHPGTA